MLTPRIKVLLSVLLAVSAYAFGRWSAPEHVKEVVKTIEVDKSKTNEHTTDHTKTVTVVTESPCNGKTTTTTVTNDVDTKKTTVENSTKGSETEKETTYASSKVSIELIAAVDITAPSGIDYGVNLSKPVLGPVTVDLFLFKSGRLGTGIGLSF